MPDSLNSNESTEWIAGDDVEITITKVEGDYTQVEVASTAGSSHPDLATHDALGLATDAELATHAATDHGAAHVADTDDAHDASAISIADAGNDFTATTVEGALDELQADNEAHVAAADPHTGYVKESDASWIDLTDSGETALHSHAGGSGVDSISKSGSAQLTGDVTLSEGANVTLTQVGQDIEVAATGAAGAPSTVDYLVGTADAGLSNEIAVGTSPGGELGGTWASPTVDATHAGSTHSAATDTHIADAADAHDASAISVDSTTLVGVGTDVQAVFEEVDNDIAALKAVDYLVGTATGTLSGEIVAGTAPGGELGGTWASPTVDATHSGSTHTAAVTTHEAAADPHTGYLKESDFDDVDFLVGTATGHTAAEIVVGTSPGGELGGTWASPTVDATHSGSTHGAAVTTHEAAGDPHTGYQLESGLQAVKFSVGALLEGAPPSNGFRMIWRAPFACTVTDVRSHFDAGTNCVVNARKNQASDFMSADFTNSTANAWGAGTVNQNQSIAAGDDIEVELVSTSGAVTKVNIQVDLTRIIPS